MMVLPVELSTQARPSLKCPIMTFSSLGMPWERVFLLSSLSQGLSLQGHRVFLLDLDFEIPLLPLTLPTSTPTGQPLTSNDWLVGEAELTPEEVIMEASKVKPSPLFPVTVLASSLETQKVRAVHSLDYSPRGQRKILRMFNKFFRHLKQEELFDFVLINLPYLNPLATQAMMAADFRFVLLDHDPLSFKMFENYIAMTVGILPDLTLSGLFLHRFQFSPAQENDAITLARLEQSLKYPVVGKLGSLKELITPHLSGSVWEVQNSDLKSFFESLAVGLVHFTHNPRQVRQKSQEVVYYDLYILYQSGLPLFSYSFGRGEGDDSRSILAGAGLTSLIAGTEAMISELLEKQESARLIEMRNVKLIIEPWKTIKAILFTNVYEEKTRRKLQGFVRHFERKHAQDLTDFIGDTGPFEEGTEELIRHYFIEETKPEELKRRLPLFLVRGIGKSISCNLQKVDVFSVQELVDTDPAELSAKVKVKINIVEDWQAQGRRILEEEGIGNVER